MIQTATQKKESYDYALLQERQRGVTGETGTLSIALANNIASRKTPSLFEDAEEEKERNKKIRAELRRLKEEQGAEFNLKTTADSLGITPQKAQLLLLEAIDETKLVRRDGKPTFLTKRQQKLVYALSMFLSQRIHEEEIEAYIKTLKEGKEPLSRITLPISLTEITKLVTIDGYARPRQKEEVKKDLKTMAEIKQVQVFGDFDTKDEKVRLVASLIEIPERIEDLTKDKELNADFLYISFGRIFFYELYNRFAIIKPSLFSIWGKSGNGTDTELFAVLLSELLSKYSGHRIASIKASEQVKKGKGDKASYYKALEKARKDALTYSEYTDTIKERVTTRYNDSREQKRRFTKDLEKAISALVQYGLITDETSIKKTPKGERVDFVFNYYYDKQEESLYSLPGVIIAPKTDINS